jgi:uncharacterized protein YprB with RNaseH-like and TPR domain
MENLLKKQLAQIKARAMRLRNVAGDTVAADTPRDVVEDVVKTGAVVRGADFVPRPARRRWPWRRRWEEDDAATVESILDRYKTGEPGPIEAVAPGIVRAVGEHSVYVVRATGRDVDPAATIEAARLCRLDRWPQYVHYSAVRGRRGARRDAAATNEPPFDAGEILFLDIETTGLSANTYVFLCGLMFVEDGGFTVEQVFARDYAEEVGLLEYVRDTMARFDTVVTYNGASFDLPFIRTRMAIHRVEETRAPGSVDLLYATRRAFRDILPNRRLVTVERHLRRVDREGDIPGRYIPDAYHDFVRTGDARAMKNVLYHNRMDLFTMAVIVTALSEPPRDPWGTTEV